VDAGRSVAALKVFRHNAFHLSDRRITRCDRTTFHDLDTTADRSGTMSWQALGWASELDIDSPIAKFILHLLANKADEKYSCFPSISTLIAESSAGRSTILRALKKLETDRYITREAQFHDSGAQRASRYYLNHPLAPHMAGRGGPDEGPPGLAPTPGPSQPQTGGVPQRDCTGVSQGDPLKPSSEPPTEPCPDAVTVIKALPWKISQRDAADLEPACRNALASGWTTASLVARLSHNPEGIRYPARVLAHRLSQLPEPPMPPPSPLAWCGECEDPQSRTITVTLPDGIEAAAFCPRCSPQGAAKRHSLSISPSEKR
jgi:Helix-turn-helix domain